MMKESVQEKIQKGMVSGRREEELIIKLIETQCGGKCYKTPRNVDFFGHIDIWWDSPKKGRLGIEVKGMKRNSQKGKRDASIQWIELVGTSGHPGWIYGEADYIAFMQEAKVIFVKRTDIVEWAERVTNGKEVVYRTPRDFYIPYCRNEVSDVERKDKVFKAPIEDLERMKHFEIFYTEELFPYWYFEER